MGLIGAALIYGDGLITPAVSVLSAVEGLNVASNIFSPYTMPLATAILVVLFIAQRFGTAGVATIFGPIMALWFAIIAILGLTEIIRQPAVLTAIYPG